MSVAVSVSFIYFLEQLKMLSMPSRPLQLSTRSRQSPAPCLFECDAQRKNLPTSGSEWNAAAASENMYESDTLLHPDERT